MPNVESISELAPPAATAGLSHTVNDETEEVVAATHVNPSVHVGTVVDCFSTDSAISHFSTGGSSVISTLSFGLTSVPQGVFYTGYVETETEYVATSAPNTFSTSRLSTSSEIAVAASSHAVKVSSWVLLNLSAFLLVSTA